MSPHVKWPRLKNTVLQIHFAIHANTFCNLDKYILQFEQLHDDAMTKDVSVCGHASHDPVSRSLPPSWAVSSAPPKISDIAKRLICVVKHNLWLFWHWLSGIIIVISYTDVSILTIVWSSDKNDKIIDICVQNLGQYCVRNMMRLMQGHRWCRPFLCRQGQFACYDSTPGARQCSTWLHNVNFTFTTF